MPLKVLIKRYQNLSVNTGEPKYQLAQVEKHITQLVNHLLKNSHDKIAMRALDRKLKARRVLWKFINGYSLDAPDNGA